MSERINSLYHLLIYLNQSIMDCILGRGPTTLQRTTYNDSNFNLILITIIQGKINSQLLKSTIYILEYEFII